MEAYSVIIRTTGKAGEKYAQLLASINMLDPQPEEIIVVLPEGFAAPKETLGREKICFCPKGMVIQRLFGIEQCNTQYALITDDDIAFESNFVSKLYQPIGSGEYSFSAGPLPEFFPNPGIQTLLSSLIGTAVPTVFHKNRYNTVLKTTGYSFNRKIEERSDMLYETQTAPWTCFFADINALREIHFEDEIWLDKCGYSAHDDTAMFYKAWLYGKKAVIVSDAPYKHLDAKTSSRGQNKKVEYANGFNTVVFWYRFLYDQAGQWSRIWCKVCLNYRLCAQKLFNTIKFWCGRMTEDERKAFVEGIKAAKNWVHSDEYRSIPPIQHE